MTADPLRLMRQYRRPRTRAGRVYGRCWRWVRETLVPVSLLVAVFMFPATAVMVQAGSAQATPVENYAADAGTVVCDVLDDYPTVDGVSGVVAGVMNDSGFTAYDSGAVVAEAVMLFCPYHVPLLRRYVAVYGEKSTTGLVLR